MLDARNALNEAQNENERLRKTIADHDEFKAVEADLQFQNDGSFYIRKSDGAYWCPTCWGDKQRACQWLR